MIFKIWEKKIFFNILKLTLLFTLAVFLLLILIDFSIHSFKIISNPNATILSIIKYYINLFMTELNIFLCLNFMLATLKVLSDMNLHHELIALNMGGISFKRISAPFFYIAILISIFSYINLQFFFPSAHEFKNGFKDYLNRNKTKKIYPNIIYLDDNTKLVYQKYDASKNELFDVFWIKSNSDIWHSKMLSMNKFPITGYWVDHLIRKNNFFEKEKSFDLYKFEDIVFDKNKKNMFAPYDHRSITTLYKQLKSKNLCTKEKAELSAHLNYKFAFPILPILIIFGIFPYMIRFSRTISIFFISAFSLFGFVIYYTLMDSFLILAENSTSYSMLIIWLPALLSFGVFFKKFKKI